MVLAKLRACVVVLFIAAAVGISGQGLAARTAADPPEAEKAGAPTEPAEAKPRPSQKAAAREEKLEGVWKMAICQRDGELTDPGRPGWEDDIRYTFSAAGKLEVTFKAAGVVEKPTLELDQQATPKEIDIGGGDPAPLPFTKQGPGKKDYPAIRGIYQQRGDTLTLCYAPAGGRRPKEFRSSKEGGEVLLVLKRVRVIENGKGGTPVLPSVPSGPRQ
jgi:uncharacterized protein (TIGR03067 family)